MLKTSVKVLALVCFLQAPVKAALLKGKVIDEHSHPVAGAKIILFDESIGKRKTAKSNGKGYFEIEHQESSQISFEVIPPSKLGLSIAQFPNVSGEASKHFIVKLHHGFLVKGRVLTQGQGIKGLKLRFYGKTSEEADASNISQNTQPSNVHAGGEAYTNGKGEFQVVLTPGAKIVQISNEIYSNLAKIYQHEFLVTGDTIVPDMTLPLIK